MAETERIVCDSHALADSGEGVRFEVNHLGENKPAFVVRYEGRVYAYLNRCRFFDMQGLLLICSNHGAIFLPESGRCIGGPCNGRNLVALPVVERDGKVIFKEFEHGGQR